MTTALRIFGEAVAEVAGEGADADPRGRGGPRDDRSRRPAELAPRRAAGRDNAR